MWGYLSANARRLGGAVESSTVFVCACVCVSLWWACRRSKHCAADPGAWQGGLYTCGGKRKNRSIDRAALYLLALGVSLSSFILFFRDSPARKSHARHESPDTLWCRTNK